MSDSTLDQVVKGAPPPNVSPTQVAESAKATAQPHSAIPPHVSTTSDPRDSLPSSPPQIYLNLLILESSLRLQYLSLRARLRLHLLLLAALSAWTLTFTYLLFFRPREDGSGVGGSVYWVLETIEKLGWFTGIVNLCLFWGTGMYARGVRWPRKFVGTTNRGLRGFNMKVVVVKGSFLSELVGWMGMLDPMGWMKEERVNFQVLPKDIESGTHKDHWNHHAARHGLVEEDTAPSGDVLKLLLLPKPFSPDFREGWETYRMEYWEKENARRHELRKVVKTRLRDVAKREGGWLWWTGWRGWQNFTLFRAKTRRQIDLEKLALRDQPSADKLKERRRKDGLLKSERAESHSRSSSRSTTPTPEPDGRYPRRTGEERVRRGSSSAGSLRRPKKAGTQSSRLSATETILGGDDVLQPLSKRASTLSNSSKDSDDVTIKKEESAEPTIKQEPDAT